MRRTIRCLAVCLAWICMAGHCFSGEEKLVITPDMQFAYADQLFKAGDFSTALVEFKRFTHFFNRDHRVKSAGYKTGICLFNLGRFHESAKAFNRIIRTDAADDLAVESVFMQSKAFEKMENVDYAQVTLNNFLMLTDDPSVKDRFLFRLAQIQVNLVKTGRNGGSLAQARKYLSRISAAGTERGNVRRLSLAIDRAETAKRKEPITAGILSVIPGAGFIYCGRYKDGLTALVLNTGLAWASLEAFNNDSPALGALLAMVEAGFYTGNIYGAVSSAHKHNAAQTRAILESGLTLSPAVDPDGRTFALMFNYPF